MILDLRTVIVMSSISSLLMAGVLLAAYRVYPRSVGGLLDWAMGCAGFGVAGILLGLRDIAPDWLSIVVANTVFVASFIFCWRGTRRLLGLALARPALWLLALASVALFLVYYTLVRPDIAPRLFLISAISCVFYGGMAWLVWSRGQHRRDELFFVGLMVFGGLAILSRVVATVLDPKATHALLSPTPAQTVALIAYNLLALLDGIGFFLLATSKLHSELQHMAERDPLTGTLNRRALANQLAIEVSVAQRKSQTMGLIVMDLDHFKQINDTLGHDGGDAVLRHFCALVHKNKRPQDLFARMGGEEFVLVLPDTDLQGAHGVAQRVLAALNRPQADSPAPYTCSFGVGVWTGRPVTPDEEWSPLEAMEAWFKRVDDAVYRAKAAGRNRIEVVDVEAGVSA